MNKKHKFIIIENKKWDSFDNKKIIREITDPVKNKYFVEYLKDLAKR